MFEPHTRHFVKKKNLKIEEGMGFKHGTATRNMATNHATKVATWQHVALTTGNSKRNMAVTVNHNEGDNMTVAVGDKIVWFHDAADPSTIRSGTVTKVRDDLCWVDNQHKPEDCICQDFTWPGRVEDQLRNVLADRAHLKKVFNDSMKLVYELRNKIARGEL